MDEVIAPTQGHSAEETALCFGIGRTECGNITDGIAVRFADRMGAFVIPWADFARAYKANAAVRRQSREDSSNG